MENIRPSGHFPSGTGHAAGKLAGRAKKSQVVEFYEPYAGGPRE